MRYFIEKVEIKCPRNGKDWRISLSAGHLYENLVDDVDYDVDDVDNEADDGVDDDDDEVNCSCGVRRHLLQARKCTNTIH